MEVMPRKRHVSRNPVNIAAVRSRLVMPRKRHVSRNINAQLNMASAPGHASQEACE